MAKSLRLKVNWNIDSQKINDGLICNWTIKNSLRTSDPPCLRMGAMLILLATELYMLYTYKPSS
jgi:hypothetical protein